MPIRGYYTKGGKKRPITGRVSGGNNSSSENWARRKRLGKLKVNTSTVEDNRGRIVAWMEGASFSHEDLKRIPRNLKNYTLEVPDSDFDGSMIVELHAINDKVAKYLAGEKYREPWTLKRVQTKTTVVR